MIPLYHCKNCKTNFDFPIKLTDGANSTVFVCPNCKSQDWGKIAV